MTEIGNFIFFHKSVIHICICKGDVLCLINVISLCSGTCRSQTHTQKKKRIKSLFTNHCLLSSRLNHNSADNLLRKFADLVAEGQSLVLQFCSLGFFQKVSCFLQVLQFSQPICLPSNK